VRIAALLLALWFAVAGVSPAKAEDLGRFVDMGAMQAAGVPPLKVTVWLPPGYDTARRRYGVVYMHDGQNLFDSTRSNFNKVWAADKSALRLIAAGTTGPFIVVGIDQPGPARYAQYLPQALYAAATPALRAKFDKMAQRLVYSDAYLAFLVATVKPAIDRRFRTSADRDHTAIVGSSMGGLISCYAFTRYPKIFGRAGCVSTHWPMGNPEETGADRDEIVSLWGNEFARGLGKPGARRLWLDHGTATLDSYYGAYQPGIDARIAALGWRKGRDFDSRVYDGAAHEENAWAARLDDVFGWLLSGWE
jgi:pimeloyl-ACP methyl ester carboxylesterase